jgi:hypothetical protein
MSKQKAASQQFMEVAIDGGSYGGWAAKYSGTVERLRSMGL